MPDYTSILRRSISALPDPDPETREAVYQRARAALARQLTAVDPPLSAREIERQHQELEHAVARLEADFALESQADADAYAPEPAAPDNRALDKSQPLAAQRVEPPTKAAFGRSDDVDDGGGAAAEDEEEDEDEEYEDDDRASRLPLMVGALLLVLVVGGAAAYGFAERDRLFSFFDSDETATQTAEAPPVRVVTPDENPNGSPAEDDAAKRPDRLTNGSEPAPAEEPPPVDTALAEPPATELQPTEPEPPPAGEAPAAPLPAESPPGLQEQSTAAVDPPGQSIVAQRAIYYFQGEEGSPGRATEGTVAWAEISRDNSPAVQATLRLAEQNVTATVTIYKNSDSTLPASHLVEVQFSGEIGGSPIQRVPALVLKQTEQARGQPLTGAAVPVTDELFWIALSDEDEQISRNLQLLREGSWFDIPILFNDGTRALLTFEKGIPGDKVFETVMSAWLPA